ncbi:hypothetical protein ACQPWW_09760 [Micromonospora sp. CA-240977]|uniref:hypothetical protein n=1 Tax=Micromonospora sp. CA-240977 TaxID=3239957 RepID=UPI003D89EFDD
MALLAGCGTDQRSARGTDPAAATSDPAAAASDPATSPAAAPASRIPAPATVTPTPPASTPGRSATPTRRPTTERTPATEQQLQKIVVRAADVPSDWVTTESMNMMLNPDANAAMTSCMGVRDTTPHMVAGVESKPYSNGPVSLQSVAASYRSEADLDVDYAMLANPRLQPCIERITREVYEQIDGTVDSMSTKVTLAPTGGPANVVGVVDNKLVGTLAGQNVVEYDRTAFIRGPLIEVQVTMASIDEPVPEALWKTILTKVAARAAGR